MLTRYRTLQRAVRNGLYRKNDPGRNEGDFSDGENLHLRQDQHAVRQQERRSDSGAICGNFEAPPRNGRACFRAKGTKFLLCLPGADAQAVTELYKTLQDAAATVRNNPINALESSKHQCRGKLVLYNDPTQYGTEENVRLPAAYFQTCAAGDNRKIRREDRET